MTERSGVVSVAELLLVTWLFAFVLLAAAGVFAHQGRLMRSQASAVRLQEARRTVELVLGTELRWAGEPDVRLVGERTIELRAARGGGAVCAVGEDWVGILHEGMREPDPAKDSVVLIAPGSEEPHRVVAASGDSLCGPGSIRLVLDRAPSDSSAYAIVFEPGSYHLAEGALRYRLGGAGRQPLTEALFGAARVAIGPDRSRLVLQLAPDPDSVGHGASAIRMPLALLNRQPPP